MYRVLVQGGAADEFFVCCYPLKIEHTLESYIEKAK